MIEELRSDFPKVTWVLDDSECVGRKSGICVRVRISPNGERYMAWVDQVKGFCGVGQGQTAKAAVSEALSDLTSSIMKWHNDVELVCQSWNLR